MTTLATENDNFGGAYKVQDFIKYTKVKNYVFWCDVSYRYNAYNMHCVIRYNRNFEDYSGNAKLFYSHTWDDSTISSIDLSTSGVGVGWSTQSDHWTQYSYGRTFKQGRATN